MKFVLFGAGTDGVKALQILGDENVECFVDNHKYGTELCGKRVVRLNELSRENKSLFLLITTKRYKKEIEQQLIEEGEKEFLFFYDRYETKMNKFLPHYNYLHNTQYMRYTDILLNYNIKQYNSIVIYGINEYLSSLLLEIAILSDLRKVTAIIGEEGKTNYYGIPNIPVDSISDTVDCVIINTPRNKSDIRDSLWIHEKEIIDIFDVDKFIFYNIHPELDIYKNIHKGKRLFIVGNGPSVRLEDLEKLHENNELSIGLNKVFKVFSKVRWRPTYLCMTDYRVISSCQKKLPDLAMITNVFLADRYNYSDLDVIPNVNYIHLKSEQFLPFFPGFSFDITKGTFWGGSVVYDIAIQLAVYMGVSEIYLIGIDHNNVGAVTNSKNHFIDNYFEADDMEKYKNVQADLESMTNAYKKAEMIAGQIGIKIFNATRGGQLEVFRRIAFDSLF